MGHRKPRRSRSVLRRPRRSRSPRRSRRSRKLIDLGTGLGAGLGAAILLYYLKTKYYDTYDNTKDTKDTKDSVPSNDILLDHFLKSNRLKIIRNDGGGNCLFIALAQYLNRYLDNNITHVELRTDIVNFIKNDEELKCGFKETLVDPRRPNVILKVNKWCKKMKKDGEYGDEHIIVAFMKQFKIPILIYDITMNLTEPIIVEGLRLYPDSPNNLANYLVQRHITQTYEHEVKPNTLVLIFSGNEIGGHYELAVRDE